MPMHSAPITEKDIASKVSQDPDDQPLIIERIRHWTREKLLPLSGDESPGTGRKRIYHQQAIPLVKIYHALTNLGVSIGKIKSCEIAALINDIEIMYRDNITNIVSKKCILSLAICFRNKSKSEPVVTIYMEDVMLLSDNNKLTTYNASSQYLRPELHPDTESAIVINLKNVFL
jgi:hypothetical protein